MIPVAPFQDLHKSPDNLVAGALERVIEILLKDASIFWPRSYNLRDIKYKQYN